MLISAKGWNLLKAEHDGTAIVSFYLGSKLKTAHVVSVQKGWNILNFLGEGWKKADRHEVIFYRAGMPPGNISFGLGGAPIIPLSEQEDLKPDEDDLGSLFEPTAKDGDPFMFSESLKEQLHAKGPVHGVTTYSTRHGKTTNSQKRGDAPFSTLHGETAHSRKLDD